MNACLIDFKSMPWECPATGIRQKAIMKDDEIIRLVEFSDSYVEAEWCTKGHIGYVLEGRIFINFESTEIEFKTGDGLFIPAGEENKHKGSIRKEEKALLVLFEKA